MGAQQAGGDSDDTFFCGANSDNCCSRGGNSSVDIVRDRATSYPLSADASGTSQQASIWPPYDKPSEDTKQATGQSTQNSGSSSTSGKETYEDGSYYVGQLRNGKRHGDGVWNSEAEQYTGQWVDDQRDGKGRQVWTDGRTYDGQFHVGKFHGRGRMEWHMKDGLMVYEGEYMEDMKHGNGRYAWPDNRVYDGQWYRGQRSGQATYFTSQGVKRRGLWKEDKVEKWLE